MRHRTGSPEPLALALIAGLIGFAPAVVADVDRAPPVEWKADAFGGYASSHILIRVREGVVPALDEAGGLLLLPPGDQNMLEEGMPETVQAVADALQAWDVTAIASALPFEPADAALASELGLDRYYRLEVPRGTDTPAMAAAFGAFDALIEIAELDGIGGIAQTFPDDTFFGSLYGLHNTGQNIDGQNGTPDADIDAPEAWDLHTGGADITLAVIDSGVDPHADLSGKLVAGWNTYDNNADTSDGVDHGTHVAGTAAGNGNNSTGVTGVSWGALVMPIRVLSDFGSGTEAHCGNGIIWAADHGADVGTMSLQYYGGTTYFHNAVIYGVNSGMVLVAATGNNQGGTVAFPARWPETIAVGAVDNRDLRPGFSNYGPQIDVCAAGVDVLSLVNTNQYAYYSGTSMATPHVSGLVCLAWSANPSLTNDEVKDIIIATAEDKGAPDWDQFYGYGRVNARAAVEAALDAGDAIVVAITSKKIKWGTRIRGNLASLADADGNSFDILSEQHPSGRHWTQLIVRAKSPETTVTRLDVTIVTGVDQGGVKTILWLRNFQTGRWDKIDAFAQPQADTISAYLEIINPNAYIRNSDGQIRARLRMRATTSDFPDGYTSRYDMVRFEVRP